MSPAVAIAIADLRSWVRLPTVRPMPLAVAVRLMRRIMVDSARARAADKRGHGMRPVSLDEAEAAGTNPADDLLRLDEALRKMEAVDARKAQVVELRAFMGLSVEETAVVLGVSAETVKRDWRLAKAWLARELAPGT